MSDFSWKRPLPLAGLAAVVAFGVVTWRQWQGPLLPGYRIEARALVQTVVGTGRIVAPTRVQAGSEITALVLERRVQEGDVVQAGDVLAVLRADDLTAKVREAEASVEQVERGARPQAAAALREAEARLAQASREVQRRRDLFQRQLIDRESLEQAEEGETVARAGVDTARVRLARLTFGDADEAMLRERLAAAKAAAAKTEIRASVAGTVLSRNVEPGDVVQAGAVLFELAGHGPTEILLPLDEKNLSVVQLGQSAQCVADAYAARVFAARVSLIVPKIDPLRGTVDVRLTVDPVPDFLRQDMTVSVNIETGRRERALVVPNDALLIGADGQAVVMALRRGRTVALPIALGLRSPTLSEVTGGLAEGDIVLADPAIGAGERVRVSLLASPSSD